MRIANPQRLLKPRSLLPAILCLIALLSGARAWAADYFNPALLDIDTPGQSKTDLSVYENGPGQAPGKYRVTLFINNKKQTACRLILSSSPPAMVTHRYSPAFPSTA